MVGGFEGIDDILIVEDNPAEIRFIEEAFNAADHDPTIHSATTKGEALDVLNQRGEYSDAPDIDLVLLDWHLSTGTGRDVLKAAKALDRGVTVVVMTGSKPELETLRSSLSAADKCIEKQTEPESYMELFRSLSDDQ